MPSQSSERTATGRNTAAITRRPVARESVTPPAHVSARPTALAFWEMHAPTLAEEGRLRQIHAETFGQLCHLHADIRQLSEQIAQEGWITATDKGQSVSPVARLLRDSRRDYVTLSGKFGLSAADEARIPTDEAARGEEDQDEKALREFTG
jgi:P27 family predicted phage terminase small subunit